MKIRSSEQWQQIDSLFAGAVSLPPEARAPYLDAACGADAELRAELERLLDASESAGEFLEKLDVKSAARLLETSASASGSIGRYKVIRKIGAGGMGIVYLAEDPSLKRRVAVKLLPPWLHGSSRANRRLLEEARAASAIDPPNIATVHEIGETTDGQLFITMTYYEGDTLRDRMQRETIAVGSAVNIALQIATGLAAAHRKGIIHRDVKPENVLITAEGTVKIVDFGLASIEAQATAQGNPAVGTAAYMSPEQATGAALDARTDVWSLGVVLFEMLAGQRPFTGNTREEILRSTRTSSLTMNERINAAPRVLQDIVTRCLAKDRLTRYSSAEQLIEDLESARAASVTAPAIRPDPAWERTGKRRARVLGAAAVLALAAVGTASAWRNARDATSRSVAAGVATDNVAASVRATTQQASLAVLPFADMSANSDRAYIADGMTEELIHALGGIDRLRVISRSSVFQLKGKEIDLREAGSKLGVAYILEGSVRSTGDKLRIVVRLVDVEQGHEVWSRVFDKTDKDVLAVEAEIARAVVAALRVKLDPAAQASLTSSSDPDAHALYLKGRRLFHQKTDLKLAIRLFREALAIDPKFARAWTELGRTWLILPVYTDVPFPQALDSAENAVRKALSIDPNLADAHATLGSMLADDWQWAESEPHFVRALQLSGGDATTHQWYGEMLLRTGRVSEAIARLKAAEELDPLLSVIPMVLGWALLDSDRKPQALAAFREAVVLNPRDVQAHVGIGYVLIATRQFSEAIAELEKAVELADGQLSARAHLARAYALGGRRAEAVQILNELRADAAKGGGSGGGSAWAVAVVTVSLGLEDETFRWLELGYQRREIGIGYLKTSEAFKPLRSDPRFVALLGKIGL